MAADHVDRLAQHARARHEQTLQQARAALTSMASDGEAITVSLLASKAGVSRSWIYTQSELRDQIERLQSQTRTGTPHRDAGNGAARSRFAAVSPWRTNESRNCAWRISNFGNRSHVLTASSAQPKASRSTTATAKELDEGRARRPSPPQ